MQPRFGTIPQVLVGDADVHVRCASQAELFAEIPDGSVQALISDPPYEQKYWPLYSECLQAASRILVGHGDLMLILPHIMCNPKFSVLLQGHDLIYRWTLALDQRDGSYARLPNNHRHIAVTWKAVGWWCRPQSGMVNRAGVMDSNLPLFDRVLTTPPKKKAHPWEQSADWAKHCLSCLFHTEGVVVDPMVGSGTLAVQALEAGYRVICGDIDQAAVDLTYEALAGDEF